MENVVSGSGMGTSDLIGQVGTLVEMGSSDRVWLGIALLHFLLPSLLTLTFAHLLRKWQWIRLGNLKVDARI